MLKCLQLFLLNHYPEKQVGSSPTWTPVLHWAGSTVHSGKSCHSIHEQRSDCRSTQGERHRCTWERNSTQLNCICIALNHRYSLTGLSVCVIINHSVDLLSYRESGLRWFLSDWQSEQPDWHGLWERWARQKLQFRVGWTQYNNHTHILGLIQVIRGTVPVFIAAIFSVLLFTTLRGKAAVWMFYCSLPWGVKQLFECFIRLQTVPEPFCCRGAVTKILHGHDVDKV